MGRVKEGAEQGMTNREAVSAINALKCNLVLTQREYEALCVAEKELLEAACKTENKPSDEPKTDKGMFIPESPNDAETDDFVGKSLAEIAVKVNQMEKEFDEVLSELKRRVDNGEKRMWFIEHKVEAVDRRVWK